jgi:peroxiredoxin/mono/diheme cytochrome c family protein
MRSTALTITLCVGLFAGPTGTAWAQEDAGTRLGKALADFRLNTTDGKALALHDLKDQRAIVVVFLSFDCPVSASYSPTLAELHKTYSTRGVAFLGVSSNADEDAAELARHVREFKLPFPVVRDDKFVAADAFKARTTPEAFVLDRHFVLRYQGRIDDQYARRLVKNRQISHHDLRDALDDLLAGKPVRRPLTEAVGCPLPREQTAKQTGKVTYHRDVQPILQNHCQSCHRSGEVGPFSLMTYRQAVKWAGDIKDYTQNRQMPPWKPSAGPAFHNDRRLTEKEIQTLAAWVDDGTPEGDPKDAPPPREFIQGWQLGKPDLVLTMDGDFQLAPGGRDVFRWFAMPTNLKEDQYVVAVEVRPGNPRIVHHALLFVDTSGEARKLELKEKAREKQADELDVGAGYNGAMGFRGFRPRGGLGGWAPGLGARYLPEGTAYFLPKGSDVVMQLHYHRNGRLEKDRTQVGLYFAKKPIEKRFQSLVIAGGRGGRTPFFIIPKNDPHFHVHGAIKVEQDCDLHTIMPHMHMIGKEITVTMTPPDGKPETLIAIKDWDYNWQEVYHFKEKVHVKAGTTLAVDAIYDNSAQNPNNPNDPPKPVLFGEQTTNEMCFVFLGATSGKPGRIKSTFLRDEKQARK